MSTVIKVSNMYGTTLSPDGVESLEIHLTPTLGLDTQVIQDAVDEAEASAAAALVSENNAAASEAAALASENAAAASESAALASENAAATSEANAATSEANALASENAAATSEANAATSESNASDSEAAALASENAAAASEAAALASENAAATSESNAATSETNAANSAAAALASENAADSSETNAANSAAAALASKNAAATSESNAATSESNAATSESNAAASALAASNSEDAAQESETNAAASAASALASKNAAATSESNAATSESNAAGSASSALSSKNAAAASASAAATSEANAAVSETNAANSAQEAADSAAAAASALRPRGDWDASSGNFPIPTLVPDERADFYQISVGGTMTDSNPAQPDVTVAVGDQLYWHLENDIWYKIDNTDQVTSVAGKQGAVVLNKTDVGLNNVDNTSDANKPVSTAQQAALDRLEDDAVVNAGTVDGLNSTQFVRSETNDTVTGELSLTKQTHFTKSQTNGRDFTDASVKVAPSATTNTTGYTTIALGSSTADNYGIGVSAHRKTTSANPDFVITHHNNSASGTEMLRMSDVSFTYKGNRVLTVADEGTGNGLDADTVDGLHASQFIRSDANDTVTGLLSITRPGEMMNFADDSMSSADGWIRLGNGAYDWAIKYVGSSSGTDGNELRFESTGASGTGKYWQMDHDGNFEYYDGSSLQTMWHSGNDGSGSGLDADKLDGLQSTSFARSDATDTISGSWTFTNDVTISKTNGRLVFDETAYATGNSGIDFLTGTDQNASLIHEISDSDLQGSYNGQVLKLIDISAAASIVGLEVDGDIYARNSQIVWHAGNDGAGSGLDADTVDGKHASDFATDDHTHDGRYARTFLLGNTGTGTGWRRVGKFTGAPNDRMHIKIAGKNSYASLSPAVEGLQESAEFNWTWGNATSGTLDAVVSCFVTAFANTPTVLTGAKIVQTATSQAELWIQHGTYHDIQVTLSSQSSNIIAIGGNNSQAEPTASVEQLLTLNHYWHSGHDGSGSGLDADLLDGIHASSFVRSDQADNINARHRYTNTDSVKLPAGSIAQRTSSPEVGDIRFNTQDDGFEGYNSRGWGSIGGGGVPEYSVLFGANRYSFSGGSNYILINSGTSALAGDYVSFMHKFPTSAAFEDRTLLAPGTIGDKHVWYNGGALRIDPDVDMTVTLDGEVVTDGYTLPTDGVDRLLKIVFNESSAIAYIGGATGGTETVHGPIYNITIDIGGSMSFFPVNEGWTSATASIIDENSNRTATGYNFTSSAWWGENDTSIDNGSGLLIETADGIEKEVELPSGVQPGDWFSIGQYGKALGTIRLTDSVYPIMGLFEDFIMDVDYQVFTFSYVDPITGWKIVNAVGESEAPSAAKTVVEGTYAEGTDTFSITYDIGYVDVFVGGYKLANTEFNAADGATVVLNNPLLRESYVYIQGWNHITVSETSAGVVSYDDSNSDVSVDTVQAALDIVTKKSELLDKVLTEYANPNIFINGDFSVDQRNLHTTVSLTSGTTLYQDRWVYRGTNGTGGSANVGFGGNVGGTYSYVTHTGATSNGYLAQKVEVNDVEVYSGKTLTLSTRARFDFTQECDVTCYWALVNTWAAISDVVKTPMTVTDVKGDTSATFTVPEFTHTWSPSEQYILVVRVDYSKEGVATPDGTYRFYNMKLEKGDVATPFIPDDYATNLHKCQYYYWNVKKGGSSLYAMVYDGSSDGSTQNKELIFDVTRMRGGLQDNGTVNIVVSYVNGTAPVESANHGGQWRMYWSGVPNTDVRGVSTLQFAAEL
ncbi:hypothetical protein VPHD260_0020 [Vibrio phage D260]